MEEDSGRKLTTHEIVQNIICEAVAAVEIPLPEPIPPSLTKGQLIKRKIKNLEQHHEQVRANIFAQLPPPSPAGIPDTKQDELTNPKLSKAIRAPDHTSARHGSTPKRPNESYSRPLITTQRKPIPSGIKDVIILMKAIEEYNEFARQGMRSLQEQENRLKESGEANAPAEMARLGTRIEKRRLSVPHTQLNDLSLNIADGARDVTLEAASTTPVAEPSSVNLSKDPRLRR